MLLEMRNSHQGSFTSSLVILYHTQLSQQGRGNNANRISQDLDSFPVETRFLKTPLQPPLSVNFINATYKSLMHHCLGGAYLFLKRRSWESHLKIHRLDHSVRCGWSWISHKNWHCTLPWLFLINGFAHL